MSDVTVFDRLKDDPAGERRLSLLRNTVAKGASDAELASFLELAHRYDLDPFAKEIWLAVDQRDGGKRNVLMMVGRDGLRKIASRNGLTVYCDVVHENDKFEVVFMNGMHEIKQLYGIPADRGAVVGAWAQVVADPLREVGYYFAPIDEWKPKSEGKLRYSPWGSQESVMILAAAERQALRQAVPLSGLIAEGEMDLNDERSSPLDTRAFANSGESDIPSYLGEPQETPPAHQPKTIEQGESVADQEPQGGSGDASARVAAPPAESPATVVVRADPEAERTRILFEIQEVDRKIGQARVEDDQDGLAQLALDRDLLVEQLNDQAGLPPGTPRERG